MKRAHSWARCAAVMPATPLVGQCRRPARAEHHPGRVTAGDPLQTAAPHRDSRRTMPVSTTAPLRSASRRPPRRSSAPGPTGSPRGWATLRSRWVGSCTSSTSSTPATIRSSRCCSCCHPGRKLRSVQRQRREGHSRDRRRRHGDRAAAAVPRRRQRDLGRHLGRRCDGHRRHHLRLRSTLGP